MAGVTLSDDYLREAEQDARRFSGAYTGTSGTLAAHVLRLLKERRELVAEAAVLRARLDEIGTVRSDEH